MDILDKPPIDDYLEHHGIKGQKWGVRRFQNKDGTYTSAGKKRYSNDAEDAEAKKRADTRRKVLIGAAVVTAVVAAYGAHRYKEYIRDKNVELAIEKGKDMARAMQLSDLHAVEKYPDVFSPKPDSYYQKYVDEAVSQAKSQKFKDALSNVKKASEKIKQEQARHASSVKDAKKAIKRLQRPKDMFDVMSGQLTLQTTQKFEPDILKELGVTLRDGAFYLKDKKLT